MNFLHKCNISVTFLGEELSNRSTDNALKCRLVIYLCGRYLLITMLNLYN